MLSFSSFSWVICHSTCFQSSSFRKHLFFGYSVVLCLLCKEFFSVLVTTLPIFSSVAVTCYETSSSSVPVMHDWTCGWNSTFPCNTSSGLARPILQQCSSNPTSQIPTHTCQSIYSTLIANKCIFSWGLLQNTTYSPLIYNKHHFKPPFNWYHTWIQCHVISWLLWNTNTMYRFFLRRVGLRVLPTQAALKCTRLREAATVPLQWEDSEMKRGRCWYLIILVQGEGENFVWIQSCTYFPCRELFRIRHTWLYCCTVFGNRICSDVEQTDVGVQPEAGTKECEFKSEGTSVSVMVLSSLC